MKKNILIPFIIIATVLFSSCNKNNGPISKEFLSLIDKVPTVSTGLNTTGSQTIDLLNLATFSGKFDVRLYFPTEAAPAKVDIVVRKNGANTNVKLFKAGITTFPSTITVSAAEIVALFGAPIALGDNYDFAPDIFLASGTKYEAFPVGANGTASGVIGQPGFSEFARFSAICAYDPNVYQGNFVVTNDAWADFSTGDVVAFTKISNTQFSFIDPFVLTPTPVVVTVNPVNNAVTITKQKIGSSWGPTYSANPATYPNPWLSGTGTVAPCAKTLTLTMTYGYRFAGVPTAEATFAGTWALVFTKQ